MKSIAFRLKPGDLLKEEIERRTKSEGVKAGVLLSIVAGLDNAKLRMAGATPNDQVVKELDGPFEVVSGTGTISAEGCHMHISISDKNGNVIGGHLKDGCVVNPTAEIVIGIEEDKIFHRTFDVATGFKELDITDQ